MGAPVRFTTEDFERVQHLSPQAQADALGCSLRTVQRHYAVLSRTDTTTRVNDTTPRVLDPASGARMMWFDRTDPRAVFGDIRTETHVLSDGRVLDVRPDVEMDFRNLPYVDETFRCVVFDPPHLVWAGRNGWLAKKYGKLDRDTWRQDLAKGFSECFRVLAEHGTLVFKWSDAQVPVSQVLALTPHKPLFGHRSGKKSGTHWMLFLK